MFINMSSFGRSFVLMRLGHFLMSVKRNTPKRLGGWVDSSLLPLILVSEKQDGQSLVVGVSPLNSAVMSGPTTNNNNEEEEEWRRLHPLCNFRQFFKLAAKDLNVDIKSYSFDTNIVEINSADVQDFLGTLDYMLKKATPNHNR